MIDWSFSKPQNDNIAPGRYTVRIIDAEETTSKAGNNMIKLLIRILSPKKDTDKVPHGYNSQLNHYIVFLKDYPYITNRLLDNLFSSFGIEQGNFDLDEWVGTTAEAEIEHKEYNGEMYSHVKKFFPLNKQKQPAQQNNNTPQRQNNDARTTTRTTPRSHVPDDIFPNNSAESDNNTDPNFGESIADIPF